MQKTRVLCTVLPLLVAIGGCGEKSASEPAQAQTAAQEAKPVAEVQTAAPAETAKPVAEVQTAAPAEAGKPAADAAAKPASGGSEPDCN